MSAPAHKTRVVTVRELADFAIDRIDRRADFARSVAKAYLADAIGPEVTAQITIDDGMSEMLRRLREIGGAKESDLPSGKSAFASKVRWEFARELLQIFVSPVESEYRRVSFPELEDSAHAA